MNHIAYNIDGQKLTIPVSNSQSFQYGKTETLSQKETDITFGQPWYSEGFTIENFIEEKQFSELKHCISDCIKNIIKSELAIQTNSFDLINYHDWVKTDEQHYKIVRKTSDLFTKDFCFPIYDLLPNLEKNLGFKLTDIDPHSSVKLHIIVRINRPHSCDYNPPHKDIYQGIDDESYIPLFMNFWIPICGVTKYSSLPLAPKSHIIPEDKILRSFEGALINNSKYRVRIIKEWNGSNTLIRPEIKYGQALIFSSHLIHGLAVNEQVDKTRVSLEFRLFKKN